MALHPMSQKYPSALRSVQVPVVGRKGDNLGGLPTSGTIILFDYSVIGIRNFSGSDLVINIKPIGDTVFYEYTIPNGEIMYDFAFDQIETAGSVGYNNAKTYYLYM